jgi:hypothetical protein
LDIATAKRTTILKSEAGINRKKQDISFEDAAKLFLDWTKVKKRAKTLQSYTYCLHQLEKSFGGKKLCEINTFLLRSISKKDWLKTRKFLQIGKSPA